MRDKDGRLKEPQYLNRVFDYSHQLWRSAFRTYHDYCFYHRSAYGILSQSKSFRNAIERSIREFVFMVEPLAIFFYFQCAIALGEIPSTCMIDTMNYGDTVFWLKYSGETGFSVSRRACAWAGLRLSNVIIVGHAGDCNANLFQYARETKILITVTIWSWQGLQHKRVGKKGSVNLVAPDWVGHNSGATIDVRNI